MNNPLFTNTTADVSQEVQNKVNTPPVDPDGFSESTLEFVKMVIGLLETGKINPLVPSSLINLSEYEVASEMARGKADTMAINLCSKLREMESLMLLEGKEKFLSKPTYQINLLVQDIQYRKEQFESQWGDLFII